MKLPQGKEEWRRPRKALETLGISTLLPRLGRHIHSTLKVTTITAVMSFVGVYDRTDAGAGLRPMRG